MQDLLPFLHEAEKLKTILRQTSTSDPRRRESSAEHSWRLALMAILCAEHVKRDLNLITILKMCLIHDLVEIEAGDLFLGDARAYAAQKKKEHIAAQKIFALLQEPEKKAYLALWEQFQAGKSDEARFVRALDRIEGVLQRSDMGKDAWQEKNIQAILEHWADDAVQDYPPLAPLWEAVREEIRGAC